MDQRQNIGPEDGSEQNKNEVSPNEEMKEERRAEDAAPSSDATGNACSYVFSNGQEDSFRSKERMSRPKRRFTVLTACITILLCTLLSFGASLAAFALGRSLWVDEGNTETDSDGSPVQGFLPFPDIGKGETTRQDHFLEDPESILDKSDSNESVYGSAGDDVFSVSEVVRRVQNAVVVIDATVVTGNFFGQSTEKVNSGSGVVISKDGYVLTCNHVVEEAKSLTVTLNDGASYEAELVGSDSASDLAILKIEPKGELTFVAQGCSADLVLGEEVVAIGNPLGTLSGTVTNGIISATEREITMSDGTKMTLLQTNAAINSGNSGGGLFNLDGQLIGIVNAKYSASGVEGLAFAIPVDFAYEVQLDLIRYGYVRGVVDTGLTLLDITEAELPYYYARFGIAEAGIYISDYPEYTEELLPRDRIVSVNGQSFANKDRLEEMLAACKVGDTVTFVVSRAGTEDKDGKVQWKEVTVEMVLREYVPDRLKEDTDKK
ncbi:MAG: trypsin-like serine protease [Ruminococcaceae bacterium]|nr:trypsin-like serine protease [Oscillospiraceae bacterium]